MARKERFVNDAVTDLSSSMDGVTTTASVSDGSVFPSEGDFRILVGEELMLVTARTGNDLTVVRGTENTPATTHNVGDSVNAILTEAALETYAEENTWHGPDAPALRLYNIADGSRAISTDFTWVNQGAATATDRGNRLVLRCPPFSGTQVRMLVMTAPTPPYSIILGARGVGHREDFGQWGLSFRESSTLKIMSIVRLFNEKLEVAKHNTATSFNSLLGSSLNWCWGPGITWFKIEDDNTDVKFYTGPNGQDWIEIGSEARNNFFTTAPNQVGFHLNPAGSNTEPSLLEVYHFGEE